MTVTRRAFIRHLSAAAIVGTAALTLASSAPPKTLILQKQMADGEWTNIAEILSWDPPVFSSTLKRFKGKPFTFVYDPSQIR